MKIIALYLPQFHEINENNQWWGKGYTEWEAVKNARPLFRNHYQPQIPLNKNYYDLSDESAITWKWQTELAKRYGVSAFCIYHYWFGNGKQLLQKPSEILLEHKEIDFPFFFCWANETWTKTWYGLSTSVLIKQEYPEDDIDKHFFYLLQFFSDQRYFCIDGKPVICLYKTKDIPYIEQMMKRWNELAKLHGLRGIFFISGNTNSGIDKREIFDARYNFEPGYTLKNSLPPFPSFSYYLRTGFCHLWNKTFHTSKIERRIPAKTIYKEIEKRFRKKERQLGKIPTFPGIFPAWDNTPRRNYLGLIYTGTSPKLFTKYVQKIAEDANPKDLFFINAWNEWGEGCHLEPDEKYAYSYLIGLQEATDTNPPD